MLLVQIGVWYLLDSSLHSTDSLIKASVLLLGGLELVLMSGVFTEFDFHKVDLSLVRWELVWLANPGPGSTYVSYMISYMMIML